MNYRAQDGPSTQNLPNPGRIATAEALRAARRQRGPQRRWGRGPEARRGVRPRHNLCRMLLDEVRCNCGFRAFWYVYFSDVVSLGRFSSATIF